MKRFLFFSFCFMIALSASAVSAQASPDGILLEMQKADPQAAQAFTNALQQGDFQTAQQIYQNFKRTTREMQAMDPQSAEELDRAVARGDFETAQKILNEAQRRRETPLGQGTSGSASDEASKPSLFERTLSGDFSAPSSSLRQFGYDTFLKTAATFTPSAAIPVGPDYIIGPGDQFTLTLWGTTEGIYAVQVTKEGNITLPKVGVVPVAGLHFGELERTLRRHLSRYYSNFNLSIAMGNLKTITIYVVGEAANPGSYSLSSLTTVYGALFAAGGPTKKGTMRNIQVLRTGKVIKTIDLYDFLLRGDRSQDTRLQHEDTVFVPLIGPVAGVSGTVYRPAIYELKGGESIGDLVKAAGGIMPIALASRLQLYRFADNEKKVIRDVQVSDPPQDAPSSGNTAAKELQEKVRNMDVINVLPIYDKVWETVNLSGDVRHSGDFQCRPDLRLKEVVQQGQLLPTADLRRAEVIRLTDDFKDRKIIPVNLAALMDGDESQNIPLRPKDRIRVYTMYRDVEKVSVAGEAASPGAYEIQKGERLSDLLRRVGGFTAEAYPYGAVFKRKDVKNAQARNLQSFIARMQSQVLQTAAGGAATAISAEEATFVKTEMTMNQSILENLKKMQEQFEGRVAINISEDIDKWAGTKDDLLLQDGDSLYIPKRPQEVMAMGEIHSPGAQVFLPGLTVKDYLEHTGGITKYADEDQIFVVQANGFAFSGNSPSVSNIEKVKLNAGDTIFVPQKLERQAGMRFTKDIIDILFKSAVVVGLIVAAF